MKFFAPIRISENISKTPEGYLLCRNVSIGRTGEMTYMAGELPLQPGPDGKIYVSRDSKELFRPETVASFEGKPLTILHPEDFVNPQNWERLTKGVVQNVRRGAGEQQDDLVADLLITVADAIELVENGLREVSCGYEADYTQAGIGRGVQTNILGNHLALVQQGRAGTAYAINDHKGDSVMTLKDKIKAIFTDAQTKALDAAGCKDESAPGTPEKVGGGVVTMQDMQSYMDAAFKKMSDSFGEMLKGKKEEKPAEDAGTPADTSTGKPAEPVAKDADPEQGAGLEGRIAKLEALVAKLVGAATGDADEEEEGEESADADSESEDADGEEEEKPGKKTGDSAPDEDEDDEEDLDVAARAEILAPGMPVEGKNVKARALRVAYATKDGKSVIEQFTGGKAPNFKDEGLVDAIFVGASEVLKSRRTNDLAGARERIRDNASKVTKSTAAGMTPEEMNKLNEEHWGKKA